MQTYCATNVLLVALVALSCTPSVVAPGKPPEAGRVVVRLGRPPWESRLKSPSWGILVERVSHVLLVPADHRVIDDYVPFALLAANYRKTFNTADMARTRLDAVSQYREALLRDFKAGKIAADSLYVIARPDLLQPQSASPDLI